MAGWNGTGTYVRARDWTTDQAGGVKMLSANFDEEHDTIATGLNNCLAKNGENAMTGALNMGSQQLQALAAGTAATHGAPVSQLQGNAYRYATSGGAANVQTLTISPAVAAYAEGQMFCFKAGFTNTAAATMNVSAIAAKNIFMHGVALTGYEIIADEIYVIVYDGTQFNLIVPGGVVPFLCQASLTADQEIPNDSGPNYVAWTSSVYDYGSLHNPASNEERFTANVAGLWRIHGQFIFDASAGGVYRSVQLVKSVTAVDGAYKYAEGFNATYRTTVAVSYTGQLDAGEFFQWSVAQDSGGALNLDKQSYCEFELVRRTG